jgi:hypothetical protein
MSLDKCSKIYCNTNVCMFVRLGTGLLKFVDKIKTNQAIYVRTRVIFDMIISRTYERRNRMLSELQDMYLRELT